jgi:hypothetical protein
MLESQKGVCVCVYCQRIVTRRPLFLQVGGAPNSPATVYAVSVEGGNILVDTSSTGKSGVPAA